VQQEEKEHPVVGRICNAEGGRIAVQQARPGAGRQLALQIVELDRHDVDDVQGRVVRELLAQADRQIAVNACDLQRLGAGLATDLGQRGVAQA
jgi:hypothetical protein